MSNKITFEVRGIDAWHDGNDWYFNETWPLGNYQTAARNERKAFTRYLKRKHGITFKNNRTLIKFDGDNYTIIDRKTKEPLFVAMYRDVEWN